MRPLPGNPVLGAACAACSTSLGTAVPSAAYRPVLTRLHARALRHHTHTHTHHLPSHAPCSGGGKSTIASMLMGLYPPKAGDILVDGTPLAQLDMQVRASRLRPQRRAPPPARRQQLRSMC